VSGATGQGQHAWSRPRRAENTAGPRTRRRGLGASEIRRAKQRYRIATRSASCLKWCWRRACDELTFGWAFHLIGHFDLLQSRRNADNLSVSLSDRGVSRLFDLSVEVCSAHEWILPGCPKVRATASARSGLGNRRRRMSALLSKTSLPWLSNLWPGEVSSLMRSSRSGSWKRPSRVRRIMCSKCLERCGRVTVKPAGACYE